MRWPWHFLLTVCRRSVNVHPPPSSILGIRGDSGVKAGTEQYGLLAQTAEQLAVNQRVGGSIPSQPAKYFCQKGSERMAGGAPRKWKSVSAMQKAIDAYFKECVGEPFVDEDGYAVRDKNGVPIIINAKPPTITGLALALGFTGRQALIDYQARPEFADTITRAKARCEEYAESRLYDRDGANGAKFSLGCNFGWREVTETKISTEPVKIVIDV